MDRRDVTTEDILSEDYAVFAGELGIDVSGTYESDEVKRLIKNHIDHLKDLLEENKIKLPSSPYKEINERELAARRWRMLEKTETPRIMAIVRDHVDKSIAEEDANAVS